MVQYNIKVYRSDRETELKARKIVAYELSELGYNEYSRHFAVLYRNELVLFAVVDYALFIFKYNIVGDSLREVVENAETVELSVADTAEVFRILSEVAYITFRET